MSSPGSDPLAISHAALEWAHPIVREWFLSKFGSPTEPQEQGWPHILAGKSVLISAPTGSGKTLAAFLACIDRLVRKALTGGLQDRTEILYVSPLKALGNDIQKNLEGPLGEILQLAGARGLLMPEIRAAVRTGDTLMPERRALLKHPPHILVTTPESLYILLTARKSREVLKTVETVIVDEIHAVADDKRGAHLALSLERLDELTGRPPIRIGLSATQKPIELIAQFLAGSRRPPPVIVHIPSARQLDLAVEVPSSELGAVASNAMWDEIYRKIAELALAHRSTLVFVNTRRLAERVAHHLGEILGNDAVAAHHGSLSRKLRLAAEKKLKAGELRLLVATASLELGIDIGTVDLVCQVGSPRAIATGLQRIGRAGHWRGAAPKGRIFATTRDELLECAALVRAIRQGELDRILIPEAPLDILAQQIVAMCSAEGWNEDDLFAALKRAYNYRELSRADFDEVVEMLSEGIAARRGRAGAYLHHDRVNHRLRGRRGARLAAITSGGAIPESALFSVVAEPEGISIGTMDEDFAVESMRGDIVLLGNTSWRIRRIESLKGRVLVEDAHGAPPNVPFWRGEAPARTVELSEQVSELREKIAAMVRDLAPGFRPEDFASAQAAVDWLKQECGLNAAGAEQAVEYIVAARAALGAVPTQKVVIAERFFDEGGGMQLVIHAPFGARINKAWGLALRKRFCRSFNFELQAAATDNGLNISLTEQHSFPLADVFRFLHPNTVKEVLEQAVLASPIFSARWRWDAGRALAVLRFTHGKKTPLQIQRMRSDDLLAAVFPDAAACQDNITGDIQFPDHPLVREVMKDVLHEALDLEGLKRILQSITQGELQCLAVDTPAPSPFSHEILNANPYAYLDDAPLEERRARAVEMRRALPERIASGAGRLDPAAIAEVRQSAWPDVRDADELEEALETLVALPEDFTPAERRPVADEWSPYFERLIAERRAARAAHAGKVFWVAAAKAKTFRSLFPDVPFMTEMAEIDGGTPNREEAALAVVRGWLAHSGPLTAAELAGIVQLPVAEVDGALFKIEAAGTALRGNFTGGADLEWCERRLLARIHSLTLGKLRKEIEPVTPAQFMRWLLDWQHAAPRTQLTGERGTFEVVRQLQGFEAPAYVWESHILPQRIAHYDPAVLDQLCLNGTVGWGRLSPHPGTMEGSEGSRRVTPSRAAPITFFVREDAEWMIPRRGGSDPVAESNLSPGARDVLDFLRQKGASFFPDIVRATGRLKAEVETALWELVAAGLITADGFDNLRALIDPKRRAGQGRGRDLRPRHSTGRWALLFPGEPQDRAQPAEPACRIFLHRYGVVFREILARENLHLTWRELLIAFRRLEDQGEVRSGRFVDGFVGEQFALPVAVESLRAVRRQASAGEMVMVSAADPLNLVGILTPGERIISSSSRVAMFRDGVPVAPVTSLPSAVGTPELQAG